MVSMARLVYERHLPSRADVEKRELTSRGTIGPKSQKIKKCEVENTTNPSTPTQIQPEYFPKPANCNPLTPLPISNPPASPGRPYMLSSRNVLKSKEKEVRSVSPSHRDEPLVSGRLASSVILSVSIYCLRLCCLCPSLPAKTPVICLSPPPLILFRSRIWFQSCLHAGKLVVA